ncbi:MAG: HlyD family secretion protein [Pedobacter sp.]|nr:HlyD family secretion protein [Pedobacter sp.]
MPKPDRKTLFRLSLTGIICLVALLLGHALWQHYMHTPWTRDGRVKADVINVAPDVSGIVTKVLIRDNQLVKKGDVLFVIDPQRYALALQQADAMLASRKSDSSQRQHEAQRREQLNLQVISEETRESSRAQATSANALYLQALGARDTAKLNLERTEVKAPADGYIGNLNVHVGDYATSGRAVLAIIDTSSFRVDGYFEETQIPLFREGDPVSIRLMSGGRELAGHVESISRGITDRDNATGQELLANINPTFSWVRLAQRIPVRIHIDEIPEDMVLAAGMTATVVVHPEERPATKKAESK